MRGGICTYIKYDGRGWSQALDADVREHFQHVAFPACNINESGKYRSQLVRVQAAVPSLGKCILSFTTEATEKD